MKWVFAPHEIDRPNIDRLESMLNVKTIRFSRCTQDNLDARVLIIDNIGMLSSAYKYASVAAIGGGFGKGIHNILEPACWGIPVLFGPNHGKFREAVELLDEGGAFSFGSYEDFESEIEKLLSDDDFYKKAALTAGDYISKNTGATAIIMSHLFSRP
jgi:3-deoxy-D-manno-octulosonic-acid transferase